MSTPDDWEFRLSPDRRQFAVWEPGNEPWFVPVPAMRGRFVGSGEMDRLGWTRFTPLADGNRADGLSEAADAVERLTADGEHDPDYLADELRLLARKARAEFTETQQHPTDVDPAALRDRIIEALLAPRYGGPQHNTPGGLPLTATSEEIRRHRAGQIADVVLPLLSPSAVQRTNRIVAYIPAAGRPGNGLHCRRCIPTPRPRRNLWTPVTAEELESGGTCTTCGVDVLIDDQGSDEQ